MRFASVIARGGGKKRGSCRSFPDDRDCKRVRRIRETKERETCDRGNTRTEGRRFPPPLALPRPTRPSLSPFPPVPHAFHPTIRFPSEHNLQPCIQGVSDQAQYQKQIRRAESLNIVIWILNEFTKVYKIRGREIMTLFDERHLVPRVRECICGNLRYIKSVYRYIYSNV